jgi:hypothetical protein
VKDFLKKYLYLNFHFDVENQLNAAFTIITKIKHYLYKNYTDDFYYFLFLQRLLKKKKNKIKHIKFFKIHVNIRLFFFFKIFKDYCTTN